MASVPVELDRRKGKSKMSKKLLTLLAVAILASLSVGLTLGATPETTTPPVQDTLNVNYFVNANTEGAPDGTVQLTNPGTSGATVCALIYVFYPDEEMTECCGCTLTPDDLRTLSINTDLTSNPLVGIPATSGVIKIVSSADTGTCDPRTITPTPSTRDWATHIIGLSTGGYVITEEEFQSATLSNAEISRLQAGCSAIVLEGSGHGICSCGTGS
jgi:hypothetical protein